MACALLISALAALPLTSTAHQPIIRTVSEYRKHLIGLAQTRPHNVDPTFDCAWRNYAVQYAAQIQPWLTAVQVQDLVDALQIDPLKCTTDDDTWKVLGDRPRTAPFATRSHDASSIYVDPVNGNDGNSGTESSPLRSLIAAVNMTRVVRPAGQAVSVILRGTGTHYIGETITLTPSDSGLAFQAYPGETPVVSGAVPVSNLSWTVHQAIPAGWSSVFNNTNTVFGSCGSEPGVPNMGKMANWQACQASCQANSSCTGWTYNGDGPFGDFTDVCCWRTDGVWTPVAENATTSQYSEAGYTIWAANWPSSAPDTVSALQIGGLRATLARFPNANIERDLFPTGYITDATWLPPAAGGDMKPVAAYTYTYVFPPEQADPGRGIYVNYTTGYGGTAARYTPPRSFWASSDFGPQAFQPTHVDDRWGEMHLRSPSGLDYGASLMRAPYADLSQAMIRTWRESHWFSWMFAVGSQVGSTAFNFSAGGHQGGEGCDIAAEWYIEGVMEELDSVNEFFFDSASRVLYFSPNASAAVGPGGAPPSSVDVPSLPVFFHLQGSQQYPVTNVTFTGLTFTAGPPTFMAPRGVPSGGDWALERMGVILLDGTEDVAITASNFTRIDGNAVFLSGYNRRASVSHNVFEWLGQSAIASWGIAAEYDGTSGEQPRGTVVSGNIAHDVGLHQKQSSFYFQAVSCETVLQDNIVYNIPRAAVNFDDGFGGGNELVGNLLFNTCQESSDHGAFNSWDRMPYLTLVRDGRTLSTIPADNDVHNNFIVANYAADGGCLDNDDGSSWYLIRNNFCVYGGHKSDFDGHSKRSIGNLHVYPSVYGPRCLAIGAQELPLSGYAEQYINNTCILATPGEAVVSLSTPKDDWPIPAMFATRLLLAGNTIFAPNGQAGYDGPGGYANYTAFQAAGFDNSSIIRADVPDAQTIITWAKALLGTASAGGAKDNGR